MSGNSDGGDGSEEEMIWSEVVRKKSARKHSCVSGSSSENEIRPERKVVRCGIVENEEFKLILRFKEGHDVRKVSPMALDISYAEAVKVVQNERRMEQREKVTLAREQTNVQTVTKLSKWMRMCCW